jgi:hypothetical protein
MSGEPPAVDRVASGPLDQRVLVALEEMHGRLAFSGLRRTLGAHPESLARALRRLEREGLVERTEQGYRSIRPPAAPPSVAVDLHPVARIEVPVGLEPDAVLSRLSGRWFGSLRWMGVVERPPQRLLAWARRDGTGSVLLGVQRGALRIYTAGGSSVEDGTDADDAAYELLVAVAETLRPSHPPGGVTFFASSDLRTGGPRLPRMEDRGSPALASNN